MRLSLLRFPPSSRILPKLVNESPSVHPLQDFPFVVISVGGKGRPSAVKLNLMRVREKQAQIINISEAAT